MVVATRPGKANTHSVVLLTSPRIGGWYGRRLDTEMRVDDGAKFGRRFEAGDQCGGRVRRDGQDHHVIVRESNAIALPKSSDFDPRVGGAQAMELVSEPHRAVALAQEARAQARSCALPSPSRAISGRQACAAGGDGFADHGARERRRARRGLDVERRQQQRPHQALIERPGESDHLADRAVVLAPRAGASAADSRRRACPAPACWT